jgi:hypothetical protein
MMREGAEISLFSLPFRVLRELRGEKFFPLFNSLMSVESGFDLNDINRFRMRSATTGRIKVRRDCHSNLRQFAVISIRHDKAFAQEPLQV